MLSASAKTMADEVHKDAEIVIVIVIVKECAQYITEEHLESLIREGLDFVQNFA